MPARSDVAADNPVPRAAVLGRPAIVKGIPLADYAAYLDERATFMGQWGLKPAARRRRPRRYEELVETEGRPRLRMWLDRHADRGPAGGGRRLRLLPVRQRGRRRWSSSTRPATSAPGSPSRGSAATGTCACPTSSARASPARSTWSRFQVVTMGSQIGRGTRRSCSPRTPTATTSSCTACRCSSPRRWRSTGTPGSARSSASPARTPTTSRASSSVDYRGCRYSFGYPACPNLEDQRQLFELLDPERIGVTLSEEFQLHPEQSTSALIVHHPEAKYFKV